LRNFHEHKVDLLAMDMWRSEDHGTSVYNYVRWSYGLEPKKSFKDVNPDPKIHKLLELMYDGDINLCHSTICTQAEIPLVK
jgi:hypothetical protein